MPKINEENQNNQNIESEKNLQEKPNIPPEGLLTEPQKDPQEEAKELVLKKWRQVVLKAIGSRNVEAPTEPQTAEETSSYNEPKSSAPKDLNQRKTIKNKERNEKSEKNKNHSNVEFEKPRSAIPPVKEKKVKKHSFFRIFFYFIIFIILIFVLLSIALYKFNLLKPQNYNSLSTQEQIINRLTKIIPYPAALIKTPCGWKNFTSSELEFDLDAMNHFYEQKKATDKKFAIPEQSQILTDIYNKELKNKLMSCLARKEGVTLSEKEIETELENTITQAGDEKQLGEITKTLYNWNLETFKTKVLSPYLLEKKLSENAGKNPAVNAAAKKASESIYNQVIKTPDDFAKLAKKYSEDDLTKNLGGDLNWIEAGQLDSALEKAAFALEVGQISKPILTPAGYHIIKVANKKTTTSGVKQIRVSHILIKSLDFNEWLNDEFEKSKIYKFI